MPFPIAAQNVYLTYGGEPILIDISLCINPGETICLLGPSGSGKTTLLKVFAGLVEPTHGSILYENTNIYKTREKRYLKFQEKTSFLFQDGALLANMSVFDNIALPLRYHSRREERLLTEMVHTVAAPFNLLTRMDKRPATLSVGARKLVALARTLVTSPEIIFFDDPTDIIDRASADKVLKEIKARTLDRNISIILSTGDIEVARELGGRAVILYDGQLLIEGTLDEINSSDDPFIMKIMKSIEQT